MKKFKMLVVPVVLGMILVGCGDKKKDESGSTKTSKSDVANVEVKEGDYVKLPSDKGKESIELNLNVKNNSKSKFYVAEDSFYLIEKGKDEKISAKEMMGSDMGSLDIYKSIINGDLSPDKSLSGKIFFEIEEGKEYVLNFSSHGFDEKSGKELEEIEVPLDLKKMEDSKKTLDEPVKAFEAYLDVVFLNKENENYKKLVSNDKEKDQEILKKEFSKAMKGMIFSSNTSDEKISKAYEQFYREQASKFKVETDLETRLSDVAIIDAKISGINDQSITSAASKIKEEYYDKTGDFDMEKESEYLVNNFEKALKEGQVNHLQDTKVTMIKKDKKWNLELNSDNYYENKKMVSSFLGNNY